MCTPLGFPHTKMAEQTQEVKTQHTGTVSNIKLVRRKQTPAPGPVHETRDEHAQATSPEAVNPVRTPLTVLERRVDFCRAKMSFLDVFCVQHAMKIVEEVSAGQPVSREVLIDAFEDSVSMLLQTRDSGEDFAKDLKRVSPDFETTIACGVAALKDLLGVDEQKNTAHPFFDPFECLRQFVLIFSLKQAEPIVAMYYGGGGAPETEFPCMRPTAVYSCMREQLHFFLDFCTKID